MKKYFIIILLLCCGCSAKYELKFIDDKITDNLTVTYKRTDETDSQINDSFSSSFYSIGRTNLYNFKNLSDKENIIVDLSYDYNINQYNSANIPNSCFDSFNFLTDDKKYYIFAQGDFKCSYYAYETLDSLDVVITSNHIVEEHNADSVKDNKYIWHIDPSSSNVNIKFVVKKETKNIKRIDYKSIMIISLSVASVILLLIIFLAIRNKFVNRI
jgi:hypothetical protein